MTKTKSRKNTSAKQAKKGKTILANTDGTAEEVEKAVEKEHVNKEEEQLKNGGNKRDELSENDEQKDDKQQRLKNSKVAKKDKLVGTRLGRIFVLFFITALTFATRYYTLREPKHVW
jgi:hypothetical protein